MRPASGSGSRRHRSPRDRFCRLGDRGDAVAALKERLLAYGYGVGQGAEFDEGTEAVVKAFQRHFRPGRVDGVADLSTQATLDRLLAWCFSPRLTRIGADAYLHRASWPDGRSGKRRKAAGEESPGSMETRCRVTPGGGNPRESATESKPPAFALTRFGAARPARAAIAGKGERVG